MKTNRVCTGCGIEKPIEAYAKHKRSRGGRRVKCRQCCNDVDRVWRHNNKDRTRATVKKWAATNKARIAEKDREYQQANKHKRRAHAAVHRAVVAGRLVRPDVCYLCGGGGDIQAHHEDYSRPLDVVWLCASCHSERHADARFVTLVR